MSTRLRSCDSASAVMSLSNTAVSGDPKPLLQAMFNGFNEEGEATVSAVEKKRRLSVEQVKALEKNFEVENKLEPEKKVKLAQELGLQPRQVAVWFQNRRARWKTKQLEREYTALKAKHDSLNLSCDELRRDNELLCRQIEELKTKLNENEHDNAGSYISVKQEPEKSPSTPHEDSPPRLIVSTAVLDGDIFNGMDLLSQGDGSSDSSESSAVLNEGNPIKHAIKSMPETYRRHTVKVEDEDNFFSGVNVRDFFSDEKAPSLQGYFGKIEEL